MDFIEVQETVSEITALERSYPQMINRLRWLRTLRTRSMKKQLRSVVLATVSLIVGGCQPAASQSEPVTTMRDAGAAAAAAQTPAAPQAEAKSAAPQNNDAQVKVLSRKENSKHGLSVLFLSSTVGDAPLNYVRIRDDKGGQDVDLRDAYLEEVFPESAREVWSPDGEYLLLSCGMNDTGFCFYEASRVRGLFGEDGFFHGDKYLDFIVVAHGGAAATEKEGYSHQFVRWDGNDSFVFKIGRATFQAATQTYHFEAVGEYKYDIKGRKLYCLKQHCEPGENRQGRVRAVTPGADTDAAAGKKERPRD